MDQEKPFRGAVNECSMLQENRLRPYGSCVICGLETGVDEDIMYEGRFIDGGGEGSGQAGELGVHDFGQDQETPEVAAARTLKTPIGPSKIERENHESTHLPFRNWCRHCVAGRGVASPHVKSKEKGIIDEVAMDYCFPRGTKEGAPKVLALRSKRDGTTLSLVVPKKGLPEEWVATRVAKAVEDIGLGNFKIITRSDGEPAMKMLKDAVSRILRERKGGGVIQEDSSKADSASNGFIEKAVQEIEGMIRTIRHHVEEKTGKKMSKGSAAMVWLIEQAGSLISRYKMGSDGLVPYKRVKGKMPSNFIMPWGEKVLYMPPKATAIEGDDGKRHRKTKDDYRYEFGIYLGIKSDSNDSWVGTASGKVITARSLRRVSEDQKWSMEDIEKILGLPWDLKATRGGEATAELEVPARAVEAPADIPPAFQKAATEVRRMKIPRDFIIKHGPTSGCDHCQGITIGREKGPGHSEACRIRMEKIMKETPDGLEKVTRGMEKMTEALIRKFERDDEDREQKRRKKTEPCADVPLCLDESLPITDLLKPKVEESNKAGRDEPSKSGEVGKRPSGNVEDSKMADAGDEGESAKRQRIDEMSSESKAIKYLPPLIGKTDRHIVHDYTRSTKNGKAWDFNVRSVRSAAMNKTVESKPSLIIVGQLRGRCHPDKLERHMKFASELATQQALEGKYFVIEGDCDSRLWQMNKIKRLKQLPGVTEFVIKKKRYDMLNDLIMITNCLDIRDAVKGMPKQKDINKESELSMPATSYSNQVPAPENHNLAIHPKELCVEIRRGMRRRTRKDEKVMRAIMDKIVNCESISEMESNLWHRYNEHQLKAECLGSLDIVAAIDSSWREESFPDHVNGGYLDAKKVLKARKEEMEYVYKYELYDKVSRELCQKRTGKSPIKVRWVDTDKGSGSGVENYRSRLVAMEFKRGGSMEYFSATPPLETLRMLLSWAASRGEGVESDAKILYLDVRRAYFHAPSKRETYIELPAEDNRSSNEGKCGRLNASMYGTRDAADNWAEEYTRVLIGLGFERGTASPCVFVHKERGVRMMVHGDDFMAVGTKAEVYWIRDEIKKVFECKEEIMGSSKEESKCLKVLNREIRWTTEGIEIEGDCRHVAAIVRGLGITECKGLAIPADKEDTLEREDVDLSGAQATAYRSIAARCNYLSLDRPDMQYATKRCCKAMCKPTARDWERLRRLGRYLKRNPRLIQSLEWQDPYSSLHVYVDSDWAGDKETRKSTSAGCICGGRHCIRAWSKDQDIIALSSAEAELHAASYGTMQTKGTQSVGRDLEWEMAINLHIDASAALGVMKRQGLGKLRHIQVRDLWLQQELKEKRLIAHKIDTKLNPADLGTKALSAEEMARHISTLGMRWSS